MVAEDIPDPLRPVMITMSGVLFLSGTESCVCLRGMCGIREQKAEGSKRQEQVQVQVSGAILNNYCDVLLFKGPVAQRSCLLLLLLHSAFRLQTLRFNQSVIPVLPLIQHSKAAGVGISEYQELIRFA